MKTLLTIVIALLCLLFFARECSRPMPPPPQISDTVIIINRIYDTVLLTRHLPKPYPVHIIRVDTIAADVDTLMILNDYFARNIYDRVLMDDSIVFIRLIDTIHQNQIIGSKVFYRNRKPVIIQQTKIINQHPPPRLYFGAVITGNTNIFGAGPSLTYYRNRQLYSLSYDAINNQISISYHHPITRPN